MSSVFLQEMGIDVWRARKAPADSSQAPAASDQESAASHKAPAASDQESAASDKAPAASNREPAANHEAKPAARRRTEARRAAPAESAQASVAPFTVLCLTKAGAVLLVEPGRQRGARRFASDLLSAATGVWGGETGQLEFRWPQAGIENAPEAVGRALGAFVSKQIADLAVGGVVLIGAEVADRLPSGVLPADALLLPPTERLMVDAGRKRAVWQEIGRRLGEA